MMLPKCQIREEACLLGGFGGCFTVCGLMVYWPVLKRTPNKVARRDLKDEVQHFFLAEAQSSAFPKQQLSL